MKTDTIYCNCGKWVEDKGEWKWYCSVSGVYIIPQADGYIRTEPHDSIIQDYWNRHKQTSEPKANGS